MENHIREGSPKNGGGYFKSGEQTKESDIDPNNFYGRERSQHLPYVDFRFNSQASLKEVFETDDYAETSDLSMLI